MFFIRKVYIRKYASQTNPHPCPQKKTKQKQNNNNNNNKKLKKMLRKSPASNDSAAIFKNADFS